jgi:hypothetical protein
MEEPETRATVPNDVRHGRSRVVAALVEHRASQVAGLFDLDSTRSHLF